MRIGVGGNVTIASSGGGNVLGLSAFPPAGAGGNRLLSVGRGPFGFGVVGASALATGVIGTAPIPSATDGVFGRSVNPSASGVLGRNDGGGFGVTGRSSLVGVFGVSSGSAVGVFGDSSAGGAGTGVFGVADGFGSTAVFGTNITSGGATGVWAQAKVVLVCTA